MPVMVPILTEDVSYKNQASCGRRTKWHASHKLEDTGSCFQLAHLQSEEWTFQQRLHTALWQAGVTNALPSEDFGSRSCSQGKGRTLT